MTGIQSQSANLVAALLNLCSLESLYIIHLCYIYDKLSHVDPHQKDHEGLQCILTDLSQCAIFIVLICHR